jgi:hypothetical protein
MIASFIHNVKGGGELWRLSHQKLSIVSDFGPSQHPKITLEGQMPFSFIKKMLKFA